MVASMVDYWVVVKVALKAVMMVALKVVLKVALTAEMKVKKIRVSQ
jgi:hypothetical protein